MLLEQVVDSVLRRYGISQPKDEEPGRVIIRRLHELLDETQASPPAVLAQKMPAIFDEKAECVETVDQDDNQAASDERSGERIEPTKTK
jgi:hypothetical protein